MTFLFLVIVLIAFTVQSLTGFGGPLIAMPLGISVVGVELAKPVITFCAWLSAAVIAVRNRKHIVYRELFKMSGIMLVFLSGGVLLILIAVLILRRKETEFRTAMLPWSFAFVLSAWTLYNFMPAEPSALWGAVYLAAEGLLLLAECRLYHRLFDGFFALNDSRDGKALPAVYLYAAVRACGIGLSLAMWAREGDASFALTVAYLAWAVLLLVTTTWLMYRFYICKPKFR